MRNKFSPLVILKLMEKFCVFGRYAISDHQATWTTASISAISSITFVDHGVERSVTDGSPSTMHLFFTLNGANRSSMIGDNCSTHAISEWMKQKNMPLSCHVSFSSEADTDVRSIFSVISEFDAVSGLYRCSLSSVGQPSAASSVLDTRLVVRAQSSSSVWNELELHFLPAVYVAASEVHVSDLQPSTFFLVVGRPLLLQQLECSVNDSSAIEVYLAQQTETTIKVVVRFNANYYSSIGRSVEFPLVVTVHSSLTSQMIDVVVRTKFFGDEASKCALGDQGTWTNLAASLLRFSQDWSLGLVSILVTGIAVYVGT